MTDNAKLTPAYTATGFLYYSDCPCAECREMATRAETQRSSHTAESNEQNEVGVQRAEQGAL